MIRQSERGGREREREWSLCGRTTTTTTTWNNRLTPITKGSNQLDHRYAGGSMPEGVALRGGEGVRVTKATFCKTCLDGVYHLLCLDPRI